MGYRKIPHRCCARSNRRVSVTDLGKKDPLIPGQQLYGTMIPRPEFDDKVHQNEIIIAEMNMKLFQSCIQQINDTDGLSDYERKQLTKLDILATNPMAVGYEVIPYNIGIEPPSRVPSIDTECEEIISESRTFQKSRRLTVKLTADKPGYIDSRETNDLILESDGKNIYLLRESAAFSSLYLFSSVDDDIIINKLSICVTALILKQNTQNHYRNPAEPFSLQTFRLERINIPYFF